MTLECTLVRGPVAAEPPTPEELTIAVPAGTSGAHLESILMRERGTGRLFVKGQDLSTLTVGIPPLVSGVVIVDGTVQKRDFGPECMSLILLTHSGPSAGKVFRIQRGRFRLGRGPVDLSVPDPGMSREHAVLEVSSTSLTLTDVEAANPVLVDEQPIRHMSVTSESTIRCGNSTFTVSAESGPLLDISTNAGRSVEEALEVSHAGKSGNRAAVILTAGLPLIAGIGLAVATGMWMYLGFTAISAVSLLVPFLTGRKSRRECRLAVARAAREDADRRRRCSPSAAELVLAAHGRSGALGRPIAETAQEPAVSAALLGSSSQSGGEPSGVWIRLGTAEESANIRWAPDDPLFSPPTIGFVPVTLDPRHAEVTLRGPNSHVDAVLRFMVMQLAAYPCAAESAVIFLGRLGRLPMSARFLPEVILTTNPEAALAALDHLKNSPDGRLIVLDHPGCQDDVLTAVVNSARLAGWQVVRCGTSAERAGPLVEISQSGTTGYLEFGGERRTFVPDLVPEGVFDAFCRNLASIPRPDSAGIGRNVPLRCSLTDLLPLGPRRILLRWEQTAMLDGLSAVLGQGPGGWVGFDLKLDGPHLLVAGTTGSGKSELLRTLVASIALSYSPAHTTFLFFDFKGGSGLRPLSGLPHCVGLLTDLGRHHLDRALASLRGEVRHREELFAAAGVTDLTQYRHAASDEFPPIPHLVLVIDEFRMLIDQAPGALSELMRVAAIGRSLGIHLVMATQRPQGALTADIRANVTSSIALRVQSETESVDIINSKAAASIRADTPGRAYLARASGRPEEFQTASLAISSDSTAPEGRGEISRDLVRSAGDALHRRSEAQSVSNRQSGLSDAGVQQLTAAVLDAWGRVGSPLPRHPVAVPLPSLIRWHEELPGSDESPQPATLWAVGPLALIDRPARQIVEPLLWLPAEHGHLAMIGSPSGGMHNCFRAVSAMLAIHGPQPHMYILDGAGILGDFDGWEGVGAKAGLHELPLAVSVLRRLSEEMDHRRRANEATRTKPLALMITGWCSWATAFRSGPSAWAEGVLQDIVRDGCPLGITVLICGDRELVSSRFFAAIQSRAYFPLGSTEESRFHWPRLPDVEPLPGRAITTGSFVGGELTVTHFREAPDIGSWPFANITSSEPPFRLRPLPGRLSEHEFRDRLETFEAQRMRAGQGSASWSDQRGATSGPGHPEGSSGAQLWVGVGGDEAIPLSLPLRLHAVTVILGSPLSGKSSTLASLHNLNPSVPWVFPTVGTSPAPFWASVARKAAEGGLNPNSILLVDDADSLDKQGRQALASLVEGVRGVVLTATPGPALVQQLPLVREVQTWRTGLVLAPRTPHDGELLGVRLEVDRTAHAGRGYLVNGADVQPFQGVLGTGFPPQVQA
ncbi:FHA domain-containing protein [Arthrobacter sp. AK01]|uniref:FtsK/SpoIIIE domain-containing protein n=1 Tax=Arthrobacter sp. AK01 TaxID=2894084 RepID=UPI001E5E3AA8|nr:FtsK/SpoIIIE domain-containing protein [Arthrobacter sp. AK01]MCD4849291.1 FHA domain-containing protein [Arthrobacter sp. AK01]